MSKIDFIPAICPSCGGELRVPDNMGVVKCMYCGKDIFIQITQEETKIGVSIKALLDLARTAEELDHFEEAENYYIQVLEYDSDNMFAWLGRGYCEGMLSTADSVENDHIVEALSYIDKGFGIEGKEESIIQLLEIFPDEYINLAIRYLKSIYLHWLGCCGEIDYQSRDSDNIYLHLLWIADWYYILSNDDPDEQKRMKRGISLFVHRVYYSVLFKNEDEEINRKVIEVSLQKSKLWNDPEIWAEVNKTKEEIQIKLNSTKKKWWWS